MDRNAVQALQREKDAIARANADDYAQIEVLEKRIFEREKRLKEIFRLINPRTIKVTLVPDIDRAAGDKLMEFFRKVQCKDVEMIFTGKSVNGRVKIVENRIEEVE